MTIHMGRRPYLSRATAGGRLGGPPRNRPLRRGVAVCFLRGRRRQIESAVDQDVRSGTFDDADEARTGRSRHCEVVDGPAVAGSMHTRARRYRSAATVDLSADTAVKVHSGESS